MAFASKLGNILKNAINTTPSLYQSIRCMSSSKLFVGGISYSTDDQSLREAFTKYGEVVEARVILDRESGRSRGFGFVTFTSSEEASAAITDMDGQNLHGRIVRVNYANDRSSGGFRSGYGGGGGFGGGGYGGGGGFGGAGYGASGGNYGGSYGDGGASGNYSGGGGGNYGGGNYGGGGSNYGGNYRGGDVGNYGGSSGDANYNVAGGSDGRTFGGNYAGSDSGLPSYNSEGGADSSNTGVDSYSSSSSSNTMDDGYPEEDADPMDEVKGDDDFEPDDYANKRS